MKGGRGYCQSWRNSMKFPYSSIVHGKPMVIYDVLYDYNDYTMVQPQEVMANVTNVTAQMVQLVDADALHLVFWR